MGEDPRPGGTGRRKPAKRTEPSVPVMRDRAPAQGARDSATSPVHLGAPRHRVRATLPKTALGRAAPVGYRFTTAAYTVAQGNIVLAARRGRSRRTRG